MAVPTRAPGRSRAGASAVFPAVRRGSALAPLAVGLAIGAYAAYFGWLSLQEYWRYQMHALDMGNMGQAAWNTVHGHPFRFTNMRLPYNIEAWNTTTRLSFHVEAIFPLISLLYLVYPHPESLLVLQTVALALGAIPVYLLATEVLYSRALGTVLAFCYLLFPALEGLNLYEFHPVALATPLLLAAFLFAWRQQYGRFVLCSLLAMGTKEQIGLVVGLMGLWVAVGQGRRRPGWLIAVAGVGWSLFAVFVIERHYRRPGTVTYLHTRYGYLGHGVRGALHTVLHDPGAITGVVFIWPKLSYVIHLLAPVGFLGLFAPAALLLGLPTLILNLLSNDFHMYSALGDNSAELISVSTIAAVFGARGALAAMGKILTPAVARTALCCYALALALVNQYTNGFTPLGPGLPLLPVSAHQRVADRFMEMVPDGVPVSTQDQLDPHLSSRRYLYLFRDTGRDAPPLVPANYIVMDVSAPTYPLHSYELYSVAQQWIHRPGWGIVAASDGLILIAPGGKMHHPPAAFYTYALGGAAKPDNLVLEAGLRPLSGGLELVGYSVQRTDAANHRVPNLAYTVYLRPPGPVSRDVQPYLFETMGSDLIGCSSDALGLSWLPTSRWHPGIMYQVHLAPLETSWQTLGTAHLWLTLGPLNVNPKLSCADLWRTHGRLWPAGSVDIAL